MVLHPSVEGEAEGLVILALFQGDLGFLIDRVAQKDRLDIRIHMARSDVCHIHPRLIRVVPAGIKDFFG